MSSNTKNLRQQKEQLETKLNDLSHEYQQKQDEVLHAYAQGYRYQNKQHDLTYNMLMSLELSDEIKNKAGYLASEFSDMLIRKRKQAEMKLDDDFQIQQKKLNNQLDELENK